MKFSSCIRVNYLIIISALLFLCSCRPGYKSLPKDRPADLKIILNETRGSSLGSSSLFISKDSSNVVYRSIKSNNKVILNIYPYEIDTIYNLLVRSGFDEIETRKDTLTKNAQGTTLKLIFGNDTVSKSNSGYTFADERSSRTFNIILQSLSDYMNRKLEGYKQDITIEFDSTILSSKKFVSLTIDDLFSYDSEKEGLKNVIPFRALYGYHTVILDLKDKQNTDKLISNFGVSSSAIEVSTERTKFIYYLDKGEIKVK
jgi:hypothetical protein